ncbi:MAG: bacteriohemerythrin [Rhodospirillaceae bacterium]
MPLMLWTEDLSVGVDSLDADHQQLFAMVNGLFDALEGGCAEPLLAALFDALIDYTRGHFTREEALMAARHYPGLARAEHVELAARVDALRDRFLSGSAEPVSQELLVLFKTWLTSHIRVTDCGYKPYVLDRPAPERPPGNEPTGN